MNAMQQSMTYEIAPLIRKAKIVSLCGIAMLAIAGCSSAPRLPERVEIPVPVACVKAEDVPVVPTLTDEASILAMDEYASTLVVWAERLELRAYAAKAEALLAACR